MLYNICYFMIGDEDMPPKAEITREKVLNEAFEIVREQGMDALTARNLAQRIKCSTQPIYSVCGSMDQLKEDVYNQAIDFALSNMRSYENEHNSPALNLGLGYLQFARNEKQLYKTVYLSGYKSFDLNQDKLIGEEMFTASMRHSKRLNKIDEKILRKIYLKLSIYIIGIATMINTDTIKISIDEASNMVTDMYEILLSSENITRND